MIQKPKGTLDILPDETPLWQMIEENVRDITSNYGFAEIKFPTFEDSALFKRGVGGTTDIVQKEMFTLGDRDGNELCLRPEGTACVVRSVIENGLFNEPMPLKLYYFTNFFRYEKPQAGRSREFYQFGVEMFGTSKASADATVISIADTLFKRLGVNARLNINSIGCPNCRPNYHKALVDYFSAHEEELCDTCRERLKTNPLRILDCKSPICGALCDNAPKTVEHLCPECEEHFDELKSSLTAMDIDFSINPRIVRGLDYYTRTVFEFISDDIGAQSTVCGGGRYDGLVKELDGPDLCGIGFGLGITRLVLALKKNAETKGTALPENKKPLIYIAPMGKEAATKAVGIVHKLRTAGVAAECDITGRSLKAQMKYADKIGAKYAAVIGDNELEQGVCELKNLRDGEKKNIAIDELSTIKD
ncbi:MAG: histidine--tRNA ligase [Ruminococcaceae bacterium]|nr:histidine--tRNA ligase [Oscillospiraceae bacterium]